MFSAEDIRRIGAVAAERLGVEQPKDIECAEGGALVVEYESGRARITAPDRCALARGLFLLGLALREGRPSLRLRQERHIPSSGVMLECSRNAVVTLEAAKRLIDQMAMLGLNLLLLYTEDTYEIPEQPYHGYLRGRFTREEYRALDDYAAGYDMELMPCIQTLGHCAQFLQWDAAAPLRDREDILLADSEAVYDYIESAVRTMRDCVRSKRIHIGMDEAHDVGLGRYLDLHGPCDRVALMRRHLDRVASICRKYDFEPIMWSDMFFRLCSKRRDYYDPEAEIPRGAAGEPPVAVQCYWDYYHDDETFYERMLRAHDNLGRSIFAGGLWAWSGFLPHRKRTEATFRPALRACLRREVDTVLATIWGDDGNETNAFLALNQLPLLSEACWLGEPCGEAESDRLGEALTGVPASAHRAMGEFYPDWRDTRTGKGLVWCDPLYPLLPPCEEGLDAAIDRFRRAEAVLEGYGGLIECRYARDVFRFAALKGEWVRDVRAKYLAGDREWLRGAVQARLPAMIDACDALMRSHRALWERDYRRNGWEVLCLRYGGALARLADVRDELERYLAGELEAIPELDETPLPCERYRGDFHYRLVTPAATTGFC